MYKFTSKFHVCIYFIRVLRKQGTQYWQIIINLKKSLHISPISHPIFESKHSCKEIHYNNHSYKQKNLILDYFLDIGMSHLTVCFVYIGLFVIRWLSLNEIEFGSSLLIFVFQIKRSTVPLRSYSVTEFQSLCTGLLSRCMDVHFHFEWSDYFFLWR